MNIMIGEKDTIPKVAKEEIPDPLKKSSLEAYGCRVATFPGITDPLAQLERIRAFKIKADDVLIATYPKSGTHWLWEVTQMLLHQKIAHDKRSKIQVMLESPGGLERSELEPSPRILNSHNVFVHLPQEIIYNKTKILHVIRNPKDVMVSLFWHLRALAGEGNLTFQALFEAVLQENLTWPSQFDYLQQVSYFEKTHPEHPILHVYFEEMKKDPVKTIKEIARFFNVPATEDFCQSVSSACSFVQMKKIEDKKMYPEEFEYINRKVTICRKGIVGDWKNHLTVAQNELFDEYISRCMEKKDFKFNFIYE